MLGRAAAGFIALLKKNDDNLGVMTNNTE